MSWFGELDIKIKELEVIFKSGNTAKFTVKDYSMLKPKIIEDFITSANELGVIFIVTTEGYVALKSNSIAGIVIK